MNLKRNKSDLVIIICSLVIILAIFIATFKLTSGSADYINIYYKNKVVTTLELSQDQVLTMKKSDYPDLVADMKIEIKNGKFRIAEEKSPYHLCSKVGWEDRPGFPVVCLPNHVMVVIEGYEDLGYDW